MSRLVHVALAVALLALAGGIRALNAPSGGEATAPGECDSCSARKKDMARMRDVLRAPAEQGK